MLETKMVVVGFDGSECSRRALDAAIAVVDEDGNVHVVMAYDAPSNREVSAAYASVPTEFTSSIDLLAGPRGELEDAAKYVARNGRRVAHHLIDDDPASAILKVAEEVDADMIVVGSRGLGRASQVVRGSVSTKIAHHSEVNFLVVH